MGKSKQTYNVITLMETQDNLYYLVDKKTFNNKKDAVAYLTDFSLEDAKNYNLLQDEFKIEEYSYENFKTHLKLIITL